MTSARSTVDESITRQVRQGGELWEVGVKAEAVPGIRGSLSPEARIGVGHPPGSRELDALLCSEGPPQRADSVSGKEGAQPHSPAAPLGLGWLFCQQKRRALPLPRRGEGRGRGWPLGGCARLWGSRWLSHHPGLLTPSCPQIVRQNRGRKACDRPVTKTKKKKKAEGTVFTEEDFQKFQQEYFGS